MARIKNVTHGPADRTPLSRRSVLERTVTAAVGVAALGGLYELADGAAAAAQQPAAQPGTTNQAGVRCVVTAHNAEGKSYVLSDRVISGGTFPNLFRSSGAEPLGIGLAAPAAFAPTDSPQLEPALGGSSFHYVMLPPRRPDDKPLWHRTLTVDYNILQAGELVLMLDLGEVVLRPGDVVIQRNTLHAWRNNSTTSPVRWVAVLVPIRRAG